MALPPETSGKIGAFQKELARIGAARQFIRENRAPDNVDKAAITRLQAAHEDAELNNKWLLIDLRKKFGRNVIRFMWFYFFFAFALLIASGIGFHGFKLPDVVLVALIGGTAVSVLGVVGTIASGLFKPPEITK